ncbi:MAG: hypothetical protein DHS20C15_32370 [Planctomycetota bacterium]|nr:MAG: hypothetical protein DHS20C15_32370 [Planctomycetota bacterium]
MADSAPSHEGWGEETPEAGPSPSAPRSGLTRFLVDGPSSAGISRETLIEAVHALLRERDYLRRARDLQLADFQVESVSQREHAEELEQRLQQETRASQEQAEALKREVAALRDEMQKLHRERAQLVAGRGEILADRNAILADRDALLVDRDQWRARCKRGLIVRTLRKLRTLAGGKTEPSARRSPVDDPTRGA